MFVLRVEIVTIFEPKMVTVSARQTNIYKICGKLCKTIFSKLYIISQPNFTNFNKFFLVDVVFDSLNSLYLD